MTETKNLSENSQNYWLARRGLRGNPFERWNAEYDQELPNYFVDIGGFDELLNQVEPCAVFASRGCGKTAQRQMLALHCRPFSKNSHKLAIVYTYNGFERVLAAVGGDVNKVMSKDHIHAILTLGVRKRITSRSVTLSEAKGLNCRQEILRFAQNDGAVGGNL